jgi:drug/metabolite transporter (DMT)-like permease
VVAVSQLDGGEGSDDRRVNVAARTERGSAALVLTCFAILYFVWGSSYVATKILVGHLPPILSAGIRFTVAGVLLMAIASWRGEPVPKGRLEWRHATVVGLLMVVVSNGCNMMAMRHVASNQSALLNATSALWIALLGTMGRQGHALSWRTRLGLAIGFAGVALVLSPRGGFSATNLGWQLLILVGCFGWAMSTLYFRTVQPRVGVLMFTGMQMIVGGGVALALGLANGDAARWEHSFAGYAALLHLLLFSSCLTYSAFAYLMTRTTPARLGTYAYVNPVVAAVLGWALLGETLSAVQIVGSVVIVAGVALVTLPQRDAAPNEPTG